MENRIEKMPLIPLRGLIIFPQMVLHFDVGREKSLLALDEAMLKEQKIFLTSQKDAKVEDPEKSDIKEIGTVCNIKQILKLPGNNVRVLVEGEERARLLEITENEPFLMAEVQIIEDAKYEDDKNCEALMRAVKRTFKEYLKISNGGSTDTLFTLDDIDEPGYLSDIVSGYIELKEAVKQEILEAIDVLDRLEKILIILKNEIEILKVEKKIGLKVKNKIDKSQREYFLREQLKAIEEELGENEDDKKEINEYKEKIEEAKLPKEIKEKALYELNRLSKMGNYSSESGVIRTYLDLVISLPWNKKTKDSLDINKARKILEEEHYGLEDVKERIIEYLAVKKISKSLKGPILCLVGPPGVGKTSIARSIAKSVNRNFVRMSLGGVKDEAEIRGHRKTYVGAIPGRIIYGMNKAKSKNPLFLLDEIDKMSNDFRGDPADALLEVLDTEQNNTFRDHYLELEFDLSSAMFVTTANTLDTIPRPLLDRMEIIQVSGYTYEEKFNIARNHLIPKQIAEHNMKDTKISFSNSAIYSIIENYTRESGVRSLERAIATVIRKAITDIVENNKKSIHVSVNHVKKYLGIEIFTSDIINKEDKVGVVTGLAWTGYGGDTLPVEVAAMKGSGKFQLTGQLGDVMKESAQTGYSYIRANADKYNISEKFYETLDLHIHVPEGAVPKDGPSAGITMITAMVSALSGKKVNSSIAMTGEVTLTGIVLPIGGLKEKTLAAFRAGIKTIIIPKANEKDLKKVPKSILSKIKIIPVENVEDVLRHALIEENLNEN
ncbi:endopeptidase La [Clostridium grantii]|uniref:Lon protease n=1 Tax=Clostridium grantii DSM 8605 TaxID=1121316 RepID=A0A1M5WBK8_9CLOT|nr:endopeptidase La [Clostridium grantii]SHH84808.1 ATP-dependent proteinase. Serine peptidase. MEROPS family S16 [Clostridium grantii DSM 8605]